MTPRTLPRTLVLEPLALLVTMHASAERVTPGPVADLVHEGQ